MPCPISEQTPFFAPLCNGPECQNDAEIECNDCFKHFCASCVQKYLEMSFPYESYNSTQHYFLCIFCFIEEQYYEIKGLQNECSGTD